MTYNICMKKSTISKLVDFVLVCVFKRLSLFVASWLVLCYLMSRSVVRIPLKCIWIEFHEIWFALQFTNAYVDIILCDFNTVGQTSPHWWQPPRHCIYFDFKQYMRDCVDLHFGVLCLKCVGCQTQIWPLPTPGLAAPNSGWLGFGSCQTRVWQLPNSGLAAAKLGLDSNRKTNHKWGPKPMDFPPTPPSVFLSSHLLGTSRYITNILSKRILSYMAVGRVMAWCTIFPMGYGSDLPTRSTSSGKVILSSVYQI